MKEQFINAPLIKNEAKKRFEIEVEGHISYINYRQFGKQIILNHTEVNPNIKGVNASLTLVEKTLQWIDENEFTLLPFCPYVFNYIKKYPHWKNIVDKRFKEYDSL